MTDRILNAYRAGKSLDATTNSVVVIGTDGAVGAWRSALGREGTELGTDRILVERGVKGNFLGALQAFETLWAGGSVAEQSETEQIVMFVGMGSRLSPLTQSLQNIKAALLLPSAHDQSGTVTVGEAALRSSAPWIRALRSAGFEGLVIRWGDEIVIPSTSLDFAPDQFAGIHAVRFGYYAQPTALLASQKEWLLADEHGNVYAEVPRQPLERLLDQVSRYRSVKALHVNLGSFAISYDLLDALREAFGDLIDDPTTAANWDPYLWMALHSSSRAEWESDCRTSLPVVPRDFAALVESIPDFWHRTQVAKEVLLASTGRAYAARVLDFGDPYWFDAGNHAALREGLSGIFSPDPAGETLRTFLGLPEELAYGGSLIRDSRIDEGASIRNSIVVGSSISTPESFAERAIIVGSTIGHLEADPGSVIIECEARKLSVDGPDGLALRLQAPAHVRGDEVTAAVATPGGSVRLSHFGPSTIIDSERFENRIWANPISFKAASGLMTGDGAASVADA